MNLEELQIKIGIELKELNKQLKQASDDINKTLGPKATKKMMTDNNKVIKDGFKVMEKTTKDSAKQINRDLNNAFDISKTMVKFNRDIDRAMGQAKRSVRSACNDIRRELNAALNVNANIRVSASASTTQRQNFGSRANTAAMVSSNQYTAAMIVKAINGMISAENKNTGRLEGAINKSTNKLVSAISKQQSKDTKIENKIEVKAPEVTVNVPEAKAPEVTIEIPEIKVPDIEIDLSQINESISKLGDELKSAISSLEDVIRLNNGQNKPVEVDSVRKPVVTKEQGGQQATSVFGTPVPNQPKQQPKVFKVQGNDNPYDLNSTTRMARESFDNAGKAVDNFVATLELLTAQLNPKKVMGSIIGGSLFDTLADNIKVSPAQENVLIGKNISDLQRQKEELERRRDRVVLPGDEKAYPAYRDALNREIEQIEKAIEQLKKSLNPIDLKIPNPDELGAKELEEITARTKESVEKFNQAIEQQTLKIQQQIKQSQAAFNAKNKPIVKKPKKIDTTNIEVPEDVIATNTGDSGKSNGVLKKYQEQAEKVKKQLNEIITGLNMMDDGPDTDELDKYEASLENIKRLLSKLHVPKNNKEEWQKASNELKHYAEAVESLQKKIKDFRSGSNEIDFTPESRRINDPNKPNIGESDNNSLNFLPHQNGLKNLSKLTEKVGAKIRKALSTAVVIGGLEFGKLPYTARIAMDKTTATLSKFSSKAKSVFGKVKRYASVALHPTAGPAKFDFLLNRIEKTALATFSKIKAKLKDLFSKVPGAGFIGSVKNILTRGLHTVKNYRYVYKKHLNKIFDGIKSTKLYQNIAKGLGLAKKALVKFASGCKTVMSKVTSTFAKGAKASLSAIGKLATGLKSLLGKMLKAVSAFAIAGVALIAKSQTLAQSEAKLTVLMKQRMSATKETVKAIRELAEEQANLGVVSETAMVRGAEQLSRYVHSAKALQTLMPAIANMTALRGGFNATPEDAEEIATQLGEAIREGTTTPLEQSGIYLSEAEIKKFQQLTTEEARAAYLADVIAKNVGDINKALANTPHGAIAQLKNNFSSLLSTLGTFLANVIQPIVKWLNVLVVAANNALKALGELLGFDMTGGGLSGVNLGTGSGGGTGTDTSGIDGATDSLEDAKDAAGEAEEAVEKFKGSLMGFDEINILSDNTNKNSGSEDEFDPTDITPGEGGQLDPGEYIPTELTEAENIFSKFGEKMKAFIDEVLEPFKNAWALLGDDLITEWKDLIESFKHFCTSLASFLKSVWDHGGKEFVQHMAEIGLAVAKAAMEIGGEILDSLARLWEHLDPAKNMHTQRFLDTLNEVSVKLRDFILGLGDHFESLMANGGQDVLNAMGDCFMDLGTAATKGLGVAIDALDGLIDHLDPANNQYTRDMLKAWEDAFHSVGECAIDFAELLESTLVNGGQDIINSLGDLGMKVGEAFGVIIDECAQALSELFKHMDPETNPHSKKMLESVNGLVKSITDFVDACIKAFKKFMDSGGREIVKNLGDILAIVIDLAAELGSGVIDIITSFMNSWAGQALIEGVAKALEWVTDKLVELSDAVDIVKDIIGNITDLFKALFEGDGEAFGKAFAELVKNIFKLTGEIKEWIGGIAKDLLLLLVEGIKALPGLLWEAAKFIFEALVSFIGELFNVDTEPFLEAGGNVVKGIGEGITGAIDWIKEAFGKVKDTVGEFIDNITSNDWWTGLSDDIKTAFSDVGSSMKEGWNNAGDWWAGVGESVKTTFDDMCTNISDGWSNIKESTSKKCSEIWESIKNVFGGSGTDEAESSLDDFAQNVSSKWQEIKNNTSERCKEIWGSIKDAFGGLKDSIADGPFSDFAQSIEDKWTSATNTVSEKASEMWTSIEDAFANMKESIVNGPLGEIVQNVGDKWNEVKDVTSERLGIAIENASVKFGELSEEISEILGGFVERTKERWEELKQDTAEKVNPMIDGVIEKYTEMKDETFVILDEWMALSEEKWGELKAKILEKIQPLVDEVVGVWTRTKDACIDVWNIMKDRCIEIWGVIKEESTKLWSDVKDHFVNAWEETKEASIQVWNETKDWCIDIWTKTKEETIEIWNNVKDHFVDAWVATKDAAIDIWNETKDWCVDIWTKTKETCIPIWNETKDHFVNAWTETKEAAIDIWNETKDWCIDVWTKTKDACIDIWSGVKDHLVNAWTETKDASIQVWNETKDWCIDIWTKTKDASVEIWNDTKDYFVDAWDKTKDAAIDIWNETKDWCIDVWNKTKEACIPIWDSIKDTCVDTWTEIEYTCGPIFDGIKDHIVNAWEETKEAAIDIWNETKDWCVDIWTKTKDASVDIWTGTKDHFVNAWTETKDASIQIWNETKDWLVDIWTKTKDACGPIVDGIKNHFVDAWTKTKEATIEIWNETIDFFGGIGEKIKEAFGSAIDGIVDFVSPKWDAVKDFFKEKGEKVVEAIMGALVVLPAMLKDLFNIDVFQALKDGMNSVLETLKGTKDLWNKAKEVGQFLIDGLCDGIETAVKALGTFVKGIGDIVIGFFKDVFGIHSPSTVFAELGGFLIDGLVKGVTDSINAVTNAFDKVCKSILSATKDISKQVSDKFKEIKDGINEKLKETKEVVSEKWGEIKTTVSEKAKDTYKAAKDNWANIKQTVSDRAKETYEAAKNKWNDLKQITTDKFNNIYSTVKDKFDKIKDTVKDKATKIYEDSSNSWTKIKDDAAKKLEQIKTDAEKRYGEIRNILVNKIEEAKKGIIEKWEEVRTKTNECIENVRKTSEEKYNQIKDTVVNKLEEIKSSTENKWEEIKNNTGTFVEKIRQEAETQYGKIKDSLVKTLENTKSAMATVWGNIKTDAISKVGEIVNQATTKFAEIKNNFSKKLDEVKNSLTSKWTSLSTQAYNGAKDLVTKAKSGMSNLGSTISDAISGSKSKVRSALNEVGKLFGQVNWSVPDLPLPHIKITGKWGFNPPSIPSFSVKWYERGGIIDGMTPLGFANGSLHMGGEAGKEMVVPLENTSFTTKIAKAMGQAVDNAMARNYNNTSNSNNPFANDNRDIVIQIDGREFARTSINQINKLQREAGRTLLDV